MNIQVDFRRPQIPATVAEIVEDASRLNPTPVFRHWIVQPDEAPIFIARIRQELKEAASARRSFVAAGARHSMGGQSIPHNGTALTLNNHRCELNVATQTYTVNAGTRWHHVIGMLDAAGFSPAVMQGNNDFSVAGSFSVNAHGWPVPCGPLGSTVQAIRLMLMDGAIVTCSRTENRELFGLVMGGYGLFGIVLDLELKMVLNCFLEATYEVMASEEFGTNFVKAIYSEPSPHMAYGRLNVARRNFLGEATMVTYRSTTTPDNGFQVASNGNLLSTATRALYRAQTGSEFGKKVRWLAETVVGPLVLPSKVTRNTLLNIPISKLNGRDHERTDILHEYFLPPERFQDFIAACQEIIPQHHQDCLNVTMRFVESDHESVLTYAPNRRIAAVMAFSQEMTPAAEADMLLLTEALIDRVLELGGSFYLPYRLHARRDQVEAAYGNTQYFVDRKYHYDPGLLFLNAMWDAYFR